MAKCGEYLILAICNFKNHRVFEYNKFHTTLRAIHSNSAKSSHGKSHRSWLSWLTQLMWDMKEERQRWSLCSPKGNAEQKKKLAHSEEIGIKNCFWSVCML